MSAHVLSEREKAQWFRERFGVSGDQLIEERRSCAGRVTLGTRSRGAPSLEELLAASRRPLTIEEAWAIVEAFERECA